MMDAKRPIPSHIIIKRPKFKSSKRKEVSHQIVVGGGKEWVKR